MKNTWSWSLVAIRSCWISRTLTGSWFTFRIILFKLDLYYTSYYFAPLFDFFPLKNNVNVASKSNKQKKLCSENTGSFLLPFWRLVTKIAGSGSRFRIRIRNRIHKSESWIRGSGSTPKCHGSGTFLWINKYVIRSTYYAANFLALLNLLKGRV